MEPILFLKGMIIGFAMAVPIGPVGVLCIRKTLAEGHAHGMIIGIGAATADALYGSIAAFGLTVISDLIASQRFWLRLVGGAILLILGVRTFRAKRKEQIFPWVGKGFLGTYISAVILVLTNPVTIFAFIAVFAAFGLGLGHSMASTVMLVVGVFVGSGLWFLTLSFVATSFRKKLDAGGLKWVNKIAGVLIIISGLAAFASLL
jgi:threonine/homoserine/homoserine lactone efflux protein